MSNCFAAAMFVAIIEMDDLFAFPFANDLRDHLCAFDDWLADADLAIPFDHPHIAQSHFIADSVRQGFNVNLVADSDAILFSATLDYCVHNVLRKFTLANNISFYSEQHFCQKN